MKITTEKLANTLSIGGRTLAFVSLLAFAASCKNQDNITPENVKENKKTESPKTAPKAFMDEQPPKNGNSGG